MTYALEAVTMATLLTEIGSFFTQAVTWMGQILETIVSNPLLMLGVAMMVCGFVVGIVRRLISVT